MQTSAIVSFLHTYALLRKRTQSCILGCFRKSTLIQITHREGSPIYFLVAVISAIIVLHRVHNVLCFHTRRSMNFPEFIPILSYSIANAVLYRQRVRCFPLRLVLVKAQQTSAFCDVRHSFGDKWVMSSVVDRRDDSVGSGFVEAMLLMLDLVVLLTRVVVLIVGRQRIDVSCWLAVGFC